MANIPPIDDAYIDEVIKAAEAYNPSLNKTQGVRLRELFKRMRDRMEQGDIGVVHTTGDESISGTKTFTVVKTTDLSLVNNGYADVLKAPAGQSQNLIHTLPVTSGNIALTTDITKSAVGLSNVDNTSDSAKPVSTAVQSLLDTKIPLSQKAVANGVATLDANGKLSTSQVPAIAVSDTFIVNSQAAMLAVSGANKGDVAVRTDVSKSFILVADPSTTLANWQELLTPVSPVQSVNGLVGAVNLTKANIGLTNVDNTADLAKPVSTATQTALNAKQNVIGYTPENAANKAVNLTAPDNTKYPTTQAVSSALSALVTVSNLALGTGTTTTVPVTNSNGTGVTLAAATTSLAGVMSSADKAKLDGVAAGATANIGTVTSVGLTAPLGLTVSGSPVTGSGTLGLSLTSGYSIPTVAKQTQWDTAFGWGNPSGVYLPLSGGSLTGQINGTAAGFSGTIVASTIRANTAFSLFNTGGAAQKVMDYTEETYNRASLNLYSQYGNNTPILGLKITSALVPNVITPGTLIGANIVANAAAGITRSFAIQSGGLNRWAVLGTSEAETGANLGSNFTISRYTDEGAILGNVLTLNRANGNALFGGALQAGPGTFAGTALNLVLRGTTAAGSNYLEFQNNAGARTAYIGHGASATNDMYYNLPAANVHRFSTSNVERLRIADDAITSTVPINGTTLTMTGNLFSSLAPTTGGHLTNKTYVDGLIAAETLQAVTTKGNITSNTIFVQGGTRPTGNPGGHALYMQTDGAGVATIESYNYATATGARLVLQGSGQGPITMGNILPIAGFQATVNTGLAISGNGSNLLLKGTGVGNNYIEFQANTGSRTAYIGQGATGSSDLYYSLPFTNFHRFVTNAIERFSITNDLVESRVPYRIYRNETPGTYNGQYTQIDHQLGAANILAKNTASAVYSEIVFKTGNNATDREVGRFNVNGDYLLSGNIALNRTPATNRGISFQSNAVGRWLLYAENSAETGTNAGSNFAFARYDDSGTYLGQALALNRATGNATFSGALQAGQGTFAGSGANIKLKATASGNNFLEFLSASDVRTAYIGHGSSTTYDMYYNLPTDNVHRFSVGNIQLASISSSLVTTEIPLKINRKANNLQFTQIDHEAGATTILSKNNSSAVFSQLLFSQGNNAADKELARFDSNGSLLIGTTTSNPLLKLIVAGDAAVSAGFRMLSDTFGAVTAGGVTLTTNTGNTTAAITMKTANVDRLVISGTGTSAFSGAVSAPSFNGPLILPNNASPWLGGMTTNAAIVAFPMTASSYHPVLRQNTLSGNVFNIGGFGEQFGFYGYLAGRTVNATDWSFTMNSATGNVLATGTITSPSFIGPLAGNAASATILQTARTINGVSFNGSVNIAIPVGVTSIGSTVGGNALTVPATAITGTGILAFTWAGTAAQYVTGQGNLAALNAAAVGLGSVNNTSDAAKPISTAAQTALNTKAAIAGQVFTGEIKGPDGTSPTSYVTRQQIPVLSTSGTGVVKMVTCINSAIFFSSNNPYLEIGVIGTAFSATLPAGTFTNNSVLRMNIGNALWQTQNNIYAELGVEVSQGSVTQFCRLLESGGTETNNMSIVFTMTARGGGIWYWSAATNISRPALVTTDFRTYAGSGGDINFNNAFTIKLKLTTTAGTTSVRILPLTIEVASL